MDHISRWIIRHRKGIVIGAAVLCVVCFVLFLSVNVNYRMTDYLPADAQSTTALALMQQEFPGGLDNLRVMVNDVSITQALEYKERIAAVPGVSSIMWLDDVVNLKTPLETADRAMVENYYKDGSALFSIAIAPDFEVSATDAIDEIIGESNSLSGDAMNTAQMQKLAVVEVVHAILILAPIIIIILLLCTTSWVEPLLYLLTICVAVLINMGTNAFFSSVSFMTQSVSPILQLAVSLDYSIFMLHSFQAFRKEGNDPETAMCLAMKRALTSVASSAATTLIGFCALLFMRFGIGSDLGLNLVKGIVLSFLSVMIFLPALTIMMVRLLDKTAHKSLLPSFKGVGKKLLKVRIPCLILAILLIVPCFMASGRNEYIYGNGKAAPTSRGGLSEQKITERFGAATPVVVLVPRGDVAREKELSDQLLTIPHVSQIIGYAAMVGTPIPAEFLPDSVKGQFYSDDWARIVAYTDTDSEGATAFATVQAIQDTVARYYDVSYSLGESVNLYDMKTIVQEDTPLVNWIAILGIALVLLFSFRSISLPVLLVFTIETAIYINLSVPYFMNSPLCYIGYLVMSTVQLGATVDYAILLTDNARLNRRTMDKRTAVMTALDDHLVSVLISGVILASAGFCLMLTSSNPIVSELGLLLGRGTLLSLAMVALVLPALLILFDKVVGKTTLAPKGKKEENS